MSIDSYRAHGGYEALRAAIQMGPDRVLREVSDSKLLGRGGAAFPTGRKWQAVARNAKRPHYLICNADESEPDTFKDRVILEDDPFFTIEAMTIAAMASGCEHGYSTCAASTSWPGSGSSTRSCRPAPAASSVRTFWARASPSTSSCAREQAPTSAERRPPPSLYVRDYAKCILCYKCVEGCGTDWQNTFAIAVAGRGFDARIATEFANPLPDSACVYCGNCIAVCPTAALMFKSEYDRRQAGTWDAERQTQTQTICTYCGVGCNLVLHEQDNEIVKVTSPLDYPAQRQPVHQGPVRLPVRAERPRRAAAADGRGRRERRRSGGLSHERRRSHRPRREPVDSQGRIAVAGADGWRYLPFEHDEGHEMRRITLEREEDGEQVSFLLPDFVEQGDELATSRCSSSAPGCAGASSEALAAEPPSPPRG
jgi:ferredoxin